MKETSLMNFLILLSNCFICLDLTDNMTRLLSLFWKTVTGSAPKIACLVWKTIKALSSLNSILISYSYSMTAISCFKASWITFLIEKASSSLMLLWSRLKTDMSNFVIYSIMGTISWISKVTEKKTANWLPVTRLNQTLIPLSRSCFLNIKDLLMMKTKLGSWP